MDQLGAALIGCSSLIVVTASARGDGSLGSFPSICDTLKTQKNVAVSTFSVWRSALMNSATDWPAQSQYNELGWNIIANSWYDVSILRLSMTACLTSTRLFQYIHTKHLHTQPCS